MEVNIKNKKYDCVKISPSLINIIRKESTGVNIYYIDHFYLEDDDIELKPFYFGIT